TTTPRGCPDDLVRATGATPPGVPPVSRPRPRRSVRTAAPARRGPAAPARATGPRSPAPGSFVVRCLVHQRPHLHLADTSERHSGRDLERPFETVDVDDVE